VNSRDSVMTDGSSNAHKVCFVATSAAMVHMLIGHGPQRVGGAELQLLKLARHLRDRGWDVSFVVGDYGQPDRAETEDEIVVYRAHRPRGSTESALRFALRSLPRLWRALRAADADIYLQRCANWIAGPIAWYCRRSGRRFVFSLASITDALCNQESEFLKSPPERWLCRRGLRQADAVIAQTREQLDLLRQHQRRDAMVIPNVWEAPNGGMPKPEPRRVLWAGSLIPLKRPLMLLEAAALVPEVEFVMAGGDSAEHEDLAEQVRARAQALPNVSLLGSVPFDELSIHYADAWALVNTSRIEGFPNTFLQAWACAAPVVATYDPDEVLCRHEIGFHCRTAGELAERIRILCTDKALRDRMGCRAQEYVRSHHDPGVVIPKVEKLLTQLIDERGT